VIFQHGLIYIIAILSGKKCSTREIPNSSPSLHFARRQRLLRTYVKKSEELFFAFFFLIFIGDLDVAVFIGDFIEDIKDLQGEFVEIVTV